MKKVKPNNKNEQRPEYQRSDFSDGFVRGKYAAKIAEKSNVVVLDPQVAEAFPNSRAVNEALLTLLRLEKPQSGRKHA